MVYNELLIYNSMGALFFFFFIIIIIIIVIIIIIIIIITIIIIIIIIILMSSSSKLKQAIFFTILCHNQIMKMFCPKTGSRLKKWYHLSPKWEIHDSGHGLNGFSIQPTTIR